MMRILTNRCIDMLRKRKRVSFFPLEDDTVVVEMPSQLSTVMEAVSQLRPELRLVVTLH